MMQAEIYLVCTDRKPQSILSSFFKAQAAPC